jgi:hypothetical protein
VGQPDTGGSRRGWGW